MSPTGVMTQRFLLVPSCRWGGHMFLRCSVRTLILRNCAKPSVKLLSGFLSITGESPISAHAVRPGRASDHLFHLGISSGFVQSHDVFFFQHRFACLNGFILHCYCWRTRICMPGVSVPTIIDMIPHTDKARN